MALTGVARFALIVMASESKVQLMGRSVHKKRLHTGHEADNVCWPLVPPMPCSSDDNPRLFEMSESPRTRFTRLDLPGFLSKEKLQYGEDQLCQSPYGILSFPKALLSRVKKLPTQPGHSAARLDASPLKQWQGFVR